jgi:hypothetical protein
MTDCWRYFAFIKMLEILRTFHNPHGMEKGDKLWREARRTSAESKVDVKTHWFRPNEIPEDARQIGLDVLLSTTSAGVRKNPKENSTRLHRQGRLVYTLQQLR